MRTGLLLTTAAALVVALPVSAAAQSDRPPMSAQAPPAADWTNDAGPAHRPHRPAVVRKNDPVWDGVLIGGAIGAVGAMVVAPYLLCGSGFDDSECVGIVRGVIGLPILAGSIVAGGLIDKFHVRGPVIWKSESGRASATVGVFPQGGAGVQITFTRSGSSSVHPSRSAYGTSQKKQR